MQNDLISRSALITEYDRLHVGAPGGARKLMEDAPDVDAQPVVHARWIRYKDDERECYCSNCEWPAALDVYRFHNVEDPYCRYCGAKMDEVTTNE